MTYNIVYYVHEIYLFIPIVFIIGTYIIKSMLIPIRIYKSLTRMYNIVSLQVIQFQK